MFCVNTEQVIYIFKPIIYAISFLGMLSLIRWNIYYINAYQLLEYIEI